MTQAFKKPTNNLVVAQKLQKVVKNQRKPSQNLKAISGDDSLTNTVLDCSQDNKNSKYKSAQ